MTSRAPKWNVHLALVLVCQTVRLIEGHPSAFAKVSPDAGSSSEDTLSISRMIEEAYRNQELLGPGQWSRRTDDGNGEGIERTQWDTSKQQEPSSDGMMQYRKRKLLQVPNTDASIYRSPDVSMHRNAGMPMHRNAGTPMHRNSDEKIIFPDGRISQMSVQSASACRGRTFCENVVDYPRQLVNTAIARNASLRFLESVDPMPDVEQRIDVIDESSLCRFREQVVYPQKAQNKQNQWLFIVNQDDLKQGIRIEVCSNDGQACNLIEGFSEGYKTTCKQKFIYRELAAVGNDGDIVKDQFRFPSSCCCHVRFIGDPSIRLGLSLSANRTQHK